MSFAVPVEDDREVESLLVGREGAVGIAAARTPSLAYSRIVVKLGGTLVRLPLRALEQAQQRSATLQEVFLRYADCQFAQLLQTAACNPVGRSKSPGYGHLKLPHLMIAVSAAEQQ
ncbi:hypothetical protein GCM10007858_30370 [Bradyrhizobium liaoningense]|uniref:hypothetical protein n=1 Tax=Bradyrhizobium liaoningense TaxID=43992 RepID=UPI00235D8252|nr:hypothetical protein [Bradyrhizobium liaoningense]GLR95402.1 hypothetical protein GCM10007858_30370 [Bradyrhizobium liaoningense]